MDVLCFTMYPYSCGSVHITRAKPANSHSVELKNLL